MKICFIGLGSIGKRHIKNLHIVLARRGIAAEIDACRSKESVLPREVLELLNRQYCSLDELPQDYDIVFITNPTVLHYDTLRKVYRKTDYLFVEKPVFNFPREADEAIFERAEKAYVACPMRFTPILKYLAESLRQEEVFSVRVISSSYLPQWRAGIDYRTNYSARSEMGGGVTLDLIHELDYLMYLFGRPVQTIHAGGRFSDLEITSDDLSVYILRYPDKLAEIHLDYFGRKSARDIELYCKDYVIKGDFIHNRLCKVREDATEWIVLPEEEDYLNEMEYFMDVVQGKKKNFNDIRYANETLRIAKA